MGRSAVLLLVVVLVFAACSSPPRPEVPPAPAPRAATTLAEELRRDLYAFADDSMLGRSAETPNAARAARFIAAKLKAAGFVAHRVPHNIGHNQWRMTFVAKAS